MRIPTIQGLIDRRILANFRVDPERLAAILPAPFRPLLVAGYGIAGICLIRLKQIRPRGLPAAIGISSENAAHRVAVEWDADGTTQSGVYIPRRDTSSRLNAAIGGRVFPGVHHRARFDVREENDHYHVAMDSLDGSAHVLVEGHRTEEIPAGSVFGSLADVSAFFEAGSLGYSPNGNGGDANFDGLELRSFGWRAEPLEVERVESSFFDDPEVFPPGSIEFDNALLMRGIEHEWHGRKSLCCT